MKHCKIYLSALIICVAPARAEVVDLGTTMVTGQKIDRSRQDTPDSVKVFDAAELDKKAKASDFYDLLDQTANVTRQGSYAYQIRGISVNGATNASDGGRTIGLFSDGAVVGSRAGQAGAMSLWDVDSVEIFRGPQSTTSGRNSLAGAIHINTKNPEFNASGQAKLGYGNYNSYQAAIAQTGPLSDKLAYRIAINHNYSDNFSENITLGGTDWDNETSTNLRGKLRYQFSPTSELLLTANHNNFDDRGDDNVQIEPPEKRQTNDNYPSTWETTAAAYSIKYTAAMADQWRLTSTSTHSKSNYDRDSDADGALGSGVLLQQTDETNTNQEFLFNYSGDKTQAVIGFYLAQGELDDAYSVSEFLFPLSAIQSQIPDNIKQALQAQGIDIAQLAPAKLRVAVDTNEKYRNAALFFNADYALTPKLTLITGLRADYEERKKDVIAGGKRDASTISPAIDQIVDTLTPRLGGKAKGTEDTVNLLPKIGVDYQFNDALNVGLVVQRGYRPGGVSVNVVRGEVKAFDAEFTTHYELSLRKSSTDKKFTLNTNLFYTDWKDQQVKLELGPSPFDSVIENAGKSHLQGAEIETRYQLTDRLKLNANLGISRTKFDEFRTARADFSGNSFPSARELTAGLGATYYHPKGYFGSVQLNYTDDAWVDAANTKKLDDFMLLNAKLGYEQDAWRIAIYLRNMLDQDYVLERYNRPAGTVDYVLGAPLTGGADIELYW